MNIWIFQSGEPLHCDQDNPRPMRAMNLANKLVEKGHKVILWSSAFSHQSKSHRSKTYQRIYISDSLEIRLIPSTGYKKNISISRFYDHCLLAWNLHRRLILEKLAPDAAFIGYPPIEPAYIMSRWLNKNNVPFFLDMKDQWPHILVKSFPIFLRPIARFILSPYFYIAKKTIKNSTAISAHVSGYIKWALLFSKRESSESDKIFPLTAPEDKIDLNSLERSKIWWSDQGISKDNSLKIIFVGSFSRAFNFDDIFNASTKLLKEGIDCQFILCGDGDRNEELRLKAKSHANIKIIEWIDRPKIIALSEISNAAIAPYKNSEDFVTSIPNKVIDSMMLGLPLLSPLEGEVKYLIEKYNVGYSYNNNTPLDECIKILGQSQDLENTLSENAKKLYASEFEFNKVYDDLATEIEGLVQ